MESSSNPPPGTPLGSNSDRSSIKTIKNIPKKYFKSDDLITLSEREEISKFQPKKSFFYAKFSQNYHQICKK
jgi:hypothetical protein